MKHEDYKEMLAASALSALDASDARELVHHLEVCSNCRSELHDWQETAAFMAFSAEPVEPSPEVRDRILAAARAETQSSSIVQPNAPAASSRVTAF